jgi:protoporphyrinogen oxidase
MLDLARTNSKRLDEVLSLIFHRIHLLVDYCTTVATVVLAFDEKDIENTYDGTGFVIARTSDTDNLMRCCH